MNFALALILLITWQFVAVNGALAEVPAPPEATTPVIKKLKTSALVTFKETGGLTGTHRTFESRIKVLPRKDERKLSELIKGSGLLSMKSPTSQVPKKNVVSYYFRVTSGKTSCEAVFDETTIPESFQPLRAFLSDRATASPET